MVQKVQGTGLSFKVIVGIAIAPIVAMAMASGMFFIMYCTSLIAQIDQNMDDGGYTRNASSALNGTHYAPSPSESYIMDHMVELGYDSPNNPPGCNIWKDPNATNGEVHQSLLSYAADLDRYNEAIRNFTPLELDVHAPIRKHGDYSLCDQLKLHPEGMSALFPSNQLSLTKSGWVEPLTPPMRFHKVCWKRDFLMSLDYLVHDFEVMCRNLKRSSRKILIDMGASLSFHDTNQPIINLLNIYEKFGFYFDHIYAFEITFTEPKQVFEKLLPAKYLQSYHWMNVGVSHEEGSKMNPLYSILQNLEEDDFVVVKLDIDTASIEVPLAKQILQGGPNGTYHRLIDQFYFEHHVHLGELAGSWTSSMDGTVKDSLQLFYDLREKGVPAHFWP